MPLHCPLLLAFMCSLVPLVAAAQTSLRFHGYGDGDVDGVKIRIDDPGDLLDEPGPPLDVGARDFTIEFWIRGSLSNNPAPAISCGFAEDWIYGNIVFDRDRWEPGGRDWGISLGEGILAFGVTNEFLESRTVCGGTMILDDAWHHVAVDRRFSDGRIRLWVDGALDGEADGPDGDVSYPGNEVSTGSQFPSFDGWLDEIRFSNVLRYDAPFIPAAAPFSHDSNTVATETPFVTVDAGDFRGMPDGVVFEAHPNPSLGQTILFARFPRDAVGDATVTIHDVSGRSRAVLDGELVSGSAMFVWDGRGPDGEVLGTGVYFAKLVAAGGEWSAKFVLR